MTPEQHQDALRDLRTDKKRLSLTLIILSLSLLVSVLYNLLTIGSDRTIVTPPIVEKSFWVNARAVSPEYLEQMGPFIAGQILNVSPSNVSYNKDLLLRYTRPEMHGDLKIRMEKEEDRLKRLNASTIYLLQRITPDEKALSVRLDGMLVTYINGNKQSESEKSYQVEFSYDGGRILLKAFEEVSRIQ